VSIGSDLPSKFDSLSRLETIHLLYVNDFVNMLLYVNDTQLSMCICMVQSYTIERCQTVSFGMLYYSYWYLKGFYGHNSAKQ